MNDFDNFQTNEKNITITTYTSHARVFMPHQGGKRQFLLERLNSLFRYYRPLLQR